MTLTEILSNIVTEIQDSSKVVFTDDVMTSKVNEALDNISVRSQAFTGINTYTITVSGTTELDLPDDFVIDKFLRINSTTAYNFNKVEEQFTDDESVVRYNIVGNTIYLVNKELDVTDTVYLFYNRLHKAMVSGSDTLEKELRGYEKMVIDYCAYSYYRIVGEYDKADSYGSSYQSQLNIFAQRQNAKNSAGLRFKTISSNNFWRTL